MILPRTLGKRTGAWAWQYSALLYWESLVEHPLLAHTRPSLNRLEGRVMPLMAAPLTMSDIWALLDLGLLAENLWVAPCGSWDRVVLDPPVRTPTVRSDR